MDLDTLVDGNFIAWQPNAVSLIKSEGDKWAIGGYASTEALDRQNEVVLAKNLDWSEFVSAGFFNDNHMQHTSAVVGVPEMVEFRKSKGWWTEGYLLKGVKRAQEIWDLAKSLEDTPRRLGFSIEGKILERFENKIVKAIIRNVAITNSPVNLECTWNILAKSFATDIEMKALSVGHARVPESGGRVLVPEDLEKDELKYVYWCPHCKKAFGSTGGLEAHLDKSHQSQPVTAEQYPTIRRAAKSLSREAAIEHLGRVRPEFSQEVRARLVDYVLQRQDG